MTFKGAPINIADNPTSKPYLGGIILLLGSCCSLPGNQDISHHRLAPKYVIKIRPSVLIQAFHSVFVNMRIKTQNVQTNITTFEIFWYTNIHINRIDIYVDGVTNSLHIIASVTSTSITYARCVNLNVYAYCDFLLPVI